MKKLEDLKLEVYDREFLGEESLKMVSNYVEVYEDDILSIGYKWRIDAFTVRFSYGLYEVILNDEKPDTIHYIINRAIEKNRITRYNTKELFEKMDFTKLPEYREYILEKFKDDIKNVFPHMIISYMNTLLHVDGSDETFYLSGLVVPSESDKGVIIEKKLDEKSLYTVEVEENGDIVYKGAGNNIIIPSDENIYDYLVDEIHDSGNQIIPGRLLKLVFDKYVDSKAKELSRIYTIFKYLLVSNSFLIKANYGGLLLEKGDKVVLLKSTDKGAVVKFVTIFTSSNPYDESTVVFGDDYTSLVRAVSRHLFGGCPKIEPSEKILNDLKELLEKEYKEPYNTVIEKFTELYNESTENEGKMMVFIDYLIDKVIHSESSKSLAKYYRYIKKGNKEYDDIINTTYSYLATNGREPKYFEIYTDVSDTYIASIPSVRLNIYTEGFPYMETVQLDIDDNFNISIYDTNQGSVDLDILTDGFKDAYKELYLSSAINNMIIRKMGDEDLLEFNKKIKVFYSDADESVFDGIVKILEDNGILKGIGLLLDNPNGTKKN